MLNISFTALESLHLHDGNNKHILHAAETVL